MIYGNVYADGHSNNSLFASEDTVHRYNPTYTPRLLREEFLAQGIEINTVDLNRGREVAFELHIEGRPLHDTTLPRYLIALENPNINKLNASRDYCANFRRVFAWDKRVQGLPNVVPILIPHPMVQGEVPGFDERDIFSCLINANKAFKEVLPSDLYLERLNIIRWYEKHAPDKFNLYGMGWDKETPAFTPLGRLKRSLVRARNKLLGRKPFPSYRGEVRDKGDVLRRSKFSWCYENSKDLSNYITEKMLDSMMYGCVPIYWGADNVLEHIPADCFVDRRNFRDTAAVHAYLQGVGSDAYAAYQEAMAKFMNSAAGRQFSSEQFATTVVEKIVHDIKHHN
ncbi:MAG TPA: glycosyltransferase family 10 [Gallionellaceae bacterium]